MASGRVLGMSLSVALAGALFGVFGGTEAASARRSGHLSGAAVDAFLRGMHASIAGCAVIALCASAVALVRGAEERQRREPRA